MPIQTVSAATRPTLTVTSPDDSLLGAIAERLIPLFLTSTQSEDQARAAALEAIEAYHPHSPADLANIARILAFSLAAIAAIGKAADPSLEPNLQLRYFGKANTLSRSADQAERVMMQRRHQPVRPRQPQAPPPQPKAKPEPAPPPSNDAILAQVDAAMAEFSALQPPHAQAKPPAPPSFRQALHQRTSLGAPHLSG
jgi:hypothetical protein